MEPTNKLIEFKQFEVKGVEVKGENDFTSYAAVFGNVDRAGDVIMPGAFKKTLAENKSFIILANHDKNKPIGRTSSASEDDYGLKIEGYLGNTDRAMEWKQLMKDGVVDSFSIGYNVTKFKRNEHGGRDIFEMKLYEASPVSIPMNEKAQLLEVKELSTEDRRDGIINRFELLSKSIGDKKLRLENEAEILKLAEEYKSATQPTEVTEPEVDEAVTFTNAFKDALK